MKSTSQILANTCWPIILLTTLAVMAFFPWLGSVHLFDWDEINFAEAAREMLVTGEYSHVQVNFESFYEKPPFFFWLQVLSMKVWGINEFAARFPNALFGLFTLLTLYFIGRRQINRQFGLLWALMHFSALLPHFYFKTGIIDPVFNYFIFLGFYSITRLFDNPKYAVTPWAWIGGISIGLAILTKGPVGGLIPMLVGLVYWVKNRCKPMINWYACIRLGIAAIILPLVWLGYETHYHGINFIYHFSRYQMGLFSEPVAGHGQPFYYHFVVVFLGCFPASILATSSLFKPVHMVGSKMFSMVKILFWVVMIFFSLSTTKIMHYSSMAYFPVSFLAAYYLYQIEQGLILASSTMQVALWIIGILLAAVFLALPIVALHKNWLYPFISNDFTLASINMPVPWSIQDCMVGISYLFFNLIAFYFFNKRKIILFVTGCVVATSSCLTLATIQIIPKIEMHTQGAAIEFYKGLVGKQVDVTTVGFKSYAPLFYFQQPPHTPVRAADLSRLLAKQLDVPAYFVTKVDDISILLAYPAIQLLYIQGGFAFFKKEASS